MDLDFVPDLTMCGQNDPHQRTIAERPPTVGRLAALINDRTGRPEDWWHLVRFDLARPSMARLDGDGDENVELWLTAWPPGYRTDRRGHATTEAATLIAGELTEITIAPDGAVEQPLRAGRVRIFAASVGSGPLGDGHMHELANLGSTYAVTLHAKAAQVSQSRSRSDRP